MFRADIDHGDTGSDNFTALAYSVQDGSHPSPPINPVADALQELQGEVEDVISGYNVRLRKIKRSGGRAFGGTTSDTEDDTASILPIEDPEQTGSPADAGRDIPPVVIGRAKEEVEAALNRVAEAEAQKTSPEEPGKAKNADAVAQSSKDAAVAVETSETSPLHEEL